MDVVFDSYNIVGTGRHKKVFVDKSGKYVYKFAKKKQFNYSIIYELESYIELMENDLDCIFSPIVDCGINDGIVYIKQLKSSREMLSKPSPQTINYYIYELIKKVIPDYLFNVHYFDEYLMCIDCIGLKNWNFDNELVDTLKSFGKQYEKYISYVKSKQEIEEEEIKRKTDKIINKIYGSEN